jgi:hypothetical protein
VVRGQIVKVDGIGLVVLLGVLGGVLDEAKLTLSPLGEELLDRHRLPDEERELDLLVLHTGIVADAVPLTRGS